jgi:hypothetical protein
MGTSSLAASGVYILLAWAFVFGSCAGTAQPAQLQPERGIGKQDASSPDSTEAKPLSASALGSAAARDVIFTRDGFGASLGYREYRPPEETQWAEEEWSPPPGQPTFAAQTTAPSAGDWLAQSPQTETLRQDGDWLGQPHGRVYYRASCQAALELPEPIYFETEQEAQRMGYQRSLVPGC